ncbi:MAG: Peptidase Ste24p [Proteobacteria bacterium]|nr:Peptidase Ste24p [Pseudomonadota bacterium]
MIDAFYYDGRSAHRHPVRLGIDSGQLHILGAGVARHVPLREVDFGEPLAGAPRCIELADGGRCEVGDSAQQAALARLIADTDAHESPVVRIQKSWRAALVAFVLVVAGSAAAYLWGLPEVARLAAQMIPPTAVQKISATALAQLDRQHFSPSRLSGARQQQLRDNASTFLTGPGLPNWRLHFRSSRALGSNALALPGGDIIVLDELVTQLDEGEINAVLAHELGHVEHRHGLRLLLQKASLAIVMAAWFGDVSAAAVGISGVLLSSGYSRAAELEADAYAARLLLRCCQSAEALISSLDQLERPTRKTGDLLASHPDTRQRIAAIRALSP